MRGKMEEPATVNSVLIELKKLSSYTYFQVLNRVEIFHIEY